MSIGKGSIPFHRIKKVTDIGSGDGLAIRMFSLQHGLPVTGIDNKSFDNVQIGRFGDVNIIEGDAVDIKDTTGLTGHLVINMYPHVKREGQVKLLELIGSTAKFVELNPDGVGYIYILTDVNLDRQEILNQFAQNLREELVITAASDFLRVTEDKLLSTNWTLEFDRFAAPYRSSKELLVTVGRKS
jgi:hypothetical protein